MFITVFVVVYMSLVVAISLVLWYWEVIESVLTTIALWGIGGLGLFVLWGLSKNIASLIDRLTKLEKVVQQCVLDIVALDLKGDSTATSILQARASLDTLISGLGIKTKPKDPEQ